jgi:hypothetical protein
MTSAGSQQKNHDLRWVAHSYRTKQIVSGSYLDDYHQAYMRLVRGRLFAKVAAASNSWSCEGEQAVTHSLDGKHDVQRSALFGLRRLMVPISCIGGACGGGQQRVAG